MLSLHSRSQPAESETSMITTFQIADIVICVNHLHDDLRALVRGYEAQEPAELNITITQQDIEFEREKSIREAIYEHLPVYDYPDGYLETLAVYRQIAAALPERKGCVFHGAVCARNGAGYLFTAKSGTGKTTHVERWLRVYPDTVVINGDKPILRERDGVIYAYGTPWAGKEGWNTNTCVPLKAICILERSADNHIERLAVKDASMMILQQIYRPSTPQGMRNTLQMVDRLCSCTELYRLGCNMENEAANVAFEGMNS